MRISDWSSDVCSSDLEDQLRNVGRIVLAVAVQRRDPRRPRGLDAGMDGGALAGIADVADDPEFGNRGLQSLKHAVCAVAGTIVDIEDFERRNGTQRAGDFQRQRRNIGLLVADGNDDRNRRSDSAWNRLAHVSPSSLAKGGVTQSGRPPVPGTSNKETGRASCRERVGESECSSEGGGPLK